MTRNSTGCDDRLLLAILQTETPGSEPQELVAHVEHCAHCQQRLEQLASAPEDWQKAGAALSEPWSGTFNATVDARRLRETGGGDGGTAWTESLARQMLAPPSHPELLGRIGRYDVERMIGAGGMGVVFKAFDSELNRPVAIKVLTPFLSGHGAARKRFAREARAAAAVVHEHVVPIYNVETERDAPFLVMQYIAGESLQQRIDRTGPLQLCEILRIGTQIASGLSAAHQQGLVHRDIKPSNILLEQGVDRALITDFGLARAADDATLTRSGFHPGTPQFMSPEQAAGEPVDARSDLFSLGSVLYTLCTGHSPFRAESTLGILRRIVDDEPRRIRETNPAIPEWLCVLISRLMSKQPADRYSSAAVAARLLEECLAHVQQPETMRLPAELSPPSPGRSYEPLLPWIRRKGQHPRVRMATAAIACAGLLFAWLFLMTPNDELDGLQGEWQLITSVRDGKVVAADQLFNERLIIRGSQFSRPQTAPDGTEIKGESGTLVVADARPFPIIDFRMWQGTIRGLYRRNDDELTLCVAHDGGPRPAAFESLVGGPASLYVYRRRKGLDRAAPLTLVDPSGPARLPGSGQTWTDTWSSRIRDGIQQPMAPDATRQWLRDNGFRNVTSAEINLKVLRQIHPDLTEESIQKDGVRTYVSGLLQSSPEIEPASALSVTALFDGDSRLLAVHVSPVPGDDLTAGQAAQPDAADAKVAGLMSRERPPMTQPTFADNAPIIACLGPEHPVRLGDIVSYADLGQGLDPSVVRLHVWDWSKSDLSRVLLIQRSEFGVLTPDGVQLFTSEGETLNVTSKQTRQFSGFTVTEGQGITSLTLSAARQYAAAMIHQPPDAGPKSGAGAKIDARHYSILRVVRLDALRNVGEIRGEYPADPNAGVAFDAQESSIVFATDRESIVRRELPSGRLLTTCTPSLDAHGAVGLAVAPDGGLIAAAGYHGTLFLWDGHTGMLRHRLESLDAMGQRDLFFKAREMRFSPDGRKLALISGNRIRIVDVEAGKLLREYRDSGWNYAQAYWSADQETITLVTAAQSLPTHVAPKRQLGSTKASLGADRLPKVFEWAWRTETPQVKVSAAVSPNPTGHIDPEIETMKLNGTWRIVDRSTAGVVQKSEIGQTVQIFGRRMGEVALELNPNRSPRTVDVVFLEGPDKGKVLRGIYEWIPNWKSGTGDGAGTGEALRICTFLRPHPDQPDLRPEGFQAGKDVDTAVWECLSHERPSPAAKTDPVRGNEESNPSPRDSQKKSP